MDIIRLPSVAARLATIWIRTFYALAFLLCGSLAAQERNQNEKQKAPAIPLGKSSAATSIDVSYQVSPQTPEANRLVIPDVSSGLIEVQNKDSAKPAEAKKDDKKDEKKDAKPEEKKEKKWYEKISFRGYTQVRFNHAFGYDDDSADPQYVGDQSVRRNQGFLIRRARMIFSGDVHERVGVYLQPDFASSVPGSTDANQFAQIRDFYADVYLDDCKINRFRIGQSKVPYGFEDLQSSSNRMPLDRADSFNSAVRNERDLGVFYYWTPQYAQELYKFVIDENLKGSGNYGVFGLGVYNGQGGSLQEVNDKVHLVSRFNVPYRFDNGQIIEAGIQGYIGRYAVSTTAIRPLGVGNAVRPVGALENGNTTGFQDRRLGASFVMYPQPIGFQAEWTVGRGPTLNDTQTVIEERSLHGGYAMLFAKYETCHHGIWFPFSRWSYFQGGYKSERNAPDVDINELESGIEWQVNKALEITVSYLITDRTNTTALTNPGDVSYRQFEGSVIRCQVQFNY